MRSETFEKYQLESSPSVASQLRVMIAIRVPAIAPPAGGRRRRCPHRPRGSFHRRAQGLAVPEQLQPPARRHGGFSLGVKRGRGGIVGLQVAVRADDRDPDPPDPVLPVALKDAAEIVAQLPENLFPVEGEVDLCPLQ